MQEAYALGSIAVFILLLLLFGLSAYLFYLKKRLSEKEVQLHDASLKEKKAAHQLIEYQDKFNEVVLKDAVTGLPCVAVFREQVERVLEQSAAHQSLFGILFLDVRRFSAINNTLGYIKGDMVLEEVGRRIQTCIRQVDAVCRFSGDVFAILLAKLNHRDSATLVVQRLFQKLIEPYPIEGHTLALQASIGISIYPVDGDDVETLFQKAATALLGAKSSTMQPFQFYQEGMQIQNHRELILNSAFSSEALFRDFYIEYQEEVDVRRNAIFSFEAILQWNHSEFGLISSREIIELAEKNGKIEALGQWMLEQMGDQLRTWGVLRGFFPVITINISYWQLESPHFVTLLLRILQEKQVNPRQLIFEIAETDLLEKNEMAEKAFSVLKQLGIKVAVRFGGGDILLHHLKDLPVDCIKIDKRFIRDIVTIKESEAVIKMIVVLARHLEKDVSATGVETIAQKNLLQELGCYRMQGGLWGKPRKATELNEKMRDPVQEDNLTVS